MNVTPHHLLPASSVPEIVVERRGIGSASWWWRLTRDGDTFSQAPRGYRSAEEAFEAAQAVLGRGRKQAAIPLTGG